MAIEPSRWIWQDGEWRDWQDAVVHVSAHALHYGSSVFEGIRAYETAEGPAVFRLTEHIRRLFQSLKIFRMEPSWSEDEVAQLCIDAVLRNELESCYIRPLAYRSGAVLGLNGLSSPISLSVLAYEWGQYLGDGAVESGVDVAVSSWRRIASGVLAPLGKIGGQYVNSQFVSMEASLGGFAEGIVLDDNGQVTEGAGQNLFLVIDGELLTPPLASSILSGITRDSVLALAADLGIPVRQECIPRELLYLADEGFFTGTASEITPLRSIDRMPVGSGEPGPVTTRLQREFFRTVRGENPGRLAWLTPVVARSEALS